MATSEFHFSPRANRAHEIAWLPWSAQAFDRAQSEDKPVLLGISAVWCHWCHVMDETTYSDPDVIATINRDFVPVRVDNDERPDINARYNMGGWPTTAFLAPDGATLTGATYLTPSQMNRVLDDIARFYRERKSEITARSHETTGARRSYLPADPEELNLNTVAHVVDEITSGYDTQFGGFGEAPKFPQPEMLELLLSEWRIGGDPRLFEMVARTMREMAHGGMYDHVEGGFFRYSTTRDWSVPHFEKMAEDHAGLVRVLAQLVLWARTEDLRDTLISTLGYLRTTLRDPQTALFAGSQDADEIYFALPTQGRAELRAPFVDRRSYTNWSAALAGAFFWAALALDDSNLLREGAEALDALHARMRDDDGLLYHVLAPGEPPRVRGLLGDQVTYLRALLDAHETTAETRFLQRAIAHAERIRGHFAASEGGFYDHTNAEAQLGRLDIADRPVVENGLLAEAFLRLSALTGEAAYRETAETTLTLYARTVGGAGSFGSTYVRALRRYLEPQLSLKIVAERGSGQAFRVEARRLSPLISILSLGPGEAAQAALPAAPAPAAYLCAGTRCGAPIRSPEALAPAFETLLAVSETPAAPRP